MTRKKEEEKRKEIEKSKKQQQSSHSVASLVVAGGNSRRLYSCGKLAIIWCILAHSLSWTAPRNPDSASYYIVGFMPALSLKYYRKNVSRTVNIFFSFNLWSIICHLLPVVVTVSSLSPVSFAAPWAPLSLVFPKQEYWSGLPFHSQRIFPTQGLNPHLLHWQVDSSLRRHQGSPYYFYLLHSSVGGRVGIGSFSLLAFLVVRNSTLGDPSQRQGYSKTIPVNPIPSFPASMGRLVTQIWSIKLKWKSAGKGVRRSNL